MVNQIFVFSYNRPDTITTSYFLEREKIKHHVLIHDNDFKKGYIAYNRVNPKRLIVTNQPKGLANNRNHALSMMKENEWAIFLVDDLVSLSEFDGYDAAVKKGVNDLKINFGNQAFWRSRMRNNVPMQRLIQRANEDIKIAEKHNLNLIGFTLNENVAYRGKHYKTWCLADGRCWVVKKTKLRFDTNAQLIDDTCFTVLNLKHFGGVLVNQWVLPLCKRYTKGGYGTKSERIEQKIKEAKYLVETYPDYIAYAKKAGWADGSHVRIKTNRGSIKID